MGGKSSTSTSTVQIPPEILARYNAVNARAETAAANPFQPYSGQFVAGITPTQQAGIQGTSAAANLAQPAYAAATGLTLAGSRPIGALTPQQIGYYQNPFTEAVVQPTLAALQQQQGQQLAQQQAQAIQGGAFGGERAGLQRAQLMGQQGLATAQAIAPLYQQGYGQAAQIAAQQQGVVASDLARQMQAGQQLAGLGTAAQQAALQGAQAQIGAGTVEQQTQQADLTARYQQFLQQQGYPFQVAQFLANIAMGTGALSGSTTSTTQPAPFFSDERLKHDAKRIGETDDGLPIYSFKYNGDDRTQIGLMAQDVEKKKPEAVGLAPASDGQMYKTVDYAKATRKKRDAGGLVPGDFDGSSMGGAVTPESMGEGFARGGYALGGPSLLSATDQNALLASNIQSELMPFSQAGLRGMPRGAMPGSMATGVVPAGKVHIPNLVTATPVGSQTGQIGLGAQALGGIETGKKIAEAGQTLQKGYGAARDWLTGKSDEDKKAHGGLAIDRHAYATNGAVDDSKEEDQGESSGVVIPGMKGGIPLGAGMKAAQLATAKAPTGGGGQRGPGNDLMDAVKLAGGIMDLGSTIGGLFGFAEGGLVPRKGYQTAGAVGNLGIAGTGLGTLGDLQAIADEPDRMPTGLVALAKDDADNLPERRIPSSLVASESGGNWRAQNEAVGHGGYKGHFGRLQFGQARLQDAVNAGVLPRGITPEQFMSDKELQKATEQWHFADIDKHIKDTGLDKAVGTTINGVPVTYEGLVNVAHLGGKGGLTKFVETGGQYDPHDANKTYLTDYLAMGAGMGRKAREPGLSFGRSGAGMYSGKPASQASLGDVAGEFLPKSVPTSADFWVPALSGLGAMLGSKSPYLLGAVGEGLVGGVSGYQAQQKQQMEQAKNMIDFVQKNFTQTVDDKNNPIVINKMTGTSYAPAAFQKFMYDSFKKIGVDPEIYGISAPTTGAGAQPERAAGISKSPPNAAAEKVAESSASPQKTSSATTPAPDTNVQSTNIYTANAGQLREMVLDGRIPGGPADGKAKQAQIDADLQRANLLANNPQPEIAARGLKLRELAQTEQKLLDEKVNQALESQNAQNKKFAEGRSERINKYTEEVQNRANKHEIGEKNLLRLAQLASEYQTGAGTEAMRNFVSYAKTLGLGRWIPENWADKPGQYDEIIKMSMTEMLNQMLQDKIIRAPATGGKFEAQTVANPGTDADGFFALIGEKLGEVRHSAAKDKAWVNRPMGSMEPAQHELTWPHEKGNDLNSFTRRAFSEIPINPAVKDTKIRSLQESFKDPDTGETFTPRRTKTPAGQPKPAAAKEAPAIPAPADRVVDQVYSTPKGNFRWKGTGWERAE